MFKLENIAYIHFDTVDSTNTWAKEHAHKLNLDRITCITAHQQTAGRGKRNRSWVSPKEENIYATLFFCIPKEVPYVMNLAQTLAIACGLALQELGFDAKIKWPNDLLIANKKVGGVLCELLTSEDRIGVILGIGLNVNMGEEKLKEIDQPATSLAALTHKKWPLEDVLRRILKTFVTTLNKLQAKGFSALKVIFEQMLAYRGEEISFHDGNERICGRLHSITEDGRLNLLLPSNEIKTYATGDLL